MQRAGYLCVEKNRQDIPERLLPGESLLSEVGKGPCKKLAALGIMKT